MNPLLKIDELSVGFANPRGVALPVRDVTLAVMPHQTLGLLGESGSGKSMTLRAILGLVPYPGEVVSGDIRWDGATLPVRNEKAIRKFRGSEISMVFQDPTSCLNPVHTVGNQLVETIRNGRAISRKAARAEAVTLLADVGIPSPERRLAAYPHQLSGGMRQRVMIALAISSQPRLLLADEPTTALDVTIQDQILQLLGRLKQERGMSVILVSHDVGVVAQHSDVIAVMYAGRVVEFGTADQVINSPRHPYTRGLLGAVPSLEVTETRQPLRSIPGYISSLMDLPPGCPFQPRCALHRDECASVDMRLDRSFPQHGSACPFAEETAP